LSSARKNKPGGVYLKKITFLIVSVAVSVLFISSMYVFYAREQKTPGERKLLEIMESTGATVLSREAYFWARLGKGRKPAAEYDTLVLELSEALGLKTGVETSSVNIICNDALWEVYANGVSPDGDMVNISGRLINQENAEKESHLVIDVTGFPNREKAGEIEGVIKKICRKYGLVPEINYCITGYFEGKLDTKGLNDVCRKAFRAAGAEKVEGIKDDNLISLTAYSPGISNYVRVDGSRVNLNIALRYNSYEKRTYIWLATPLIAIEY
jgi:hypothetical protein